MNSSEQNEKRIKKSTFKDVFLNKKIIGALFLTLFLILFFHLGSVITMPEVVIPTDAYNNSNTFVQTLNLLSGGGLTQVSIFSIGVGPYITSQIIVQLLSTDLVPSLTRMSKSGERGKRKLEIITRFLTLPFCLIQSYAVLALIMTGDSITVFGQTAISALTSGEIMSLMLLMTSGTYIAIFLADMITKRGIGNGITLIILSGIVSSLFSNFNVAFRTIATGFNSTNAHQLTILLSDCLYVMFFVILLMAVVFVNGSTRKIPIQQTGQGLITSNDELPFLPIKLNAAGVIPVIFASSIMTIPGTIAQFLPNAEAKWFINDYLTLDSWCGISIYGILIILFSFFYSYVQINPPQMAENFEKGGKYIPGVRIGEDTEKHIWKVLYRINWIGAPFLSFIAMLPYGLSILTGIPSGMALGGTGIIIMVTGSIEFWNAVKSTGVTVGYNTTKKQIQSSTIDNESAEGQNVTQLW